MADLSKNLADLDSQLKVKKISAASFKRKTAADLSKDITNIHGTISTLAGATRKIVVRVGAIEKIVENQSKKITSLKNISKTQSKRIGGDTVGEKLPTVESEKGSGVGLKRITTLLDDIIEILKNQNKAEGKRLEGERKASERDSRNKRESLLESGLGFAFRAAEKVMAPVKSLLSRIMDFIMYAFLGRVAIKLLRWFSDKGNKKKVDSIIRFLKNSWPFLLTLYLRFGTSLGRFIGKLGGVLARGALRLAGLGAKLLAKAGLKGAGKFASFALGPRGKAVAAIAGVAADVAIMSTASNAIGNFGGIGGNENKKPPVEPQQYSGGGFVIPRFGGGGFNFGNILKGAGSFGPLAMLLSGANQVGEMFNGFVSGEKGIDKIPAMLSHGEFVMSAGAVRKYGVDALEAMNAAGGGTNRPTQIGGKTYAAGGGLIFGDSIASGLAGRRGGNKQLTSDNMGTSMVGASPAEVLTMLQNYGPGRFKGKTVYLSTGITNNISGLSAVEAQLKLLKDSGATVKVLGVTQRPPRGRTDLNGLPAMNNKLKQLATQYGASFTGGFSPGSDGIHPANYNFASMSTGPSGSLDSQSYREPYSPTPRAGELSPTSPSSAPPSASPTAPKPKPIANVFLMNNAQPAQKNAAWQKAIKEASQKRLNQLSYAATGRRYSVGRRFEAESSAKTKEWYKRGGDWGGFTRGLMRMFTDPDSRIGKARLARMDAADKASDARVKQSGAASIGRYYSSSDGKYYKDYNAAVKAKKIRLAEMKKKRKDTGITTPVMSNIYVRQSRSGKSGSPGRGGSGGKPQVPSFSASHPHGHTQVSTIYQIK